MGNKDVTFGEFFYRLVISVPRSNLCNGEKVSDLCPGFSSPV